MNSVRDTPKGWVSPFGHPRINDRSHLPAAFRSVPRPSSPLGAKASTECPSLTPYPHHRPRTGPNHAPCNYLPIRAAAPASSTASRSNSAGRCASLTHTTDHLHHVKEHAVPQATRFPLEDPGPPPRNETALEVSPPFQAAHHASTVTGGHPTASSPTSRTSARKEMETVGFEPTTPCLQSRCSPTELRPRGRWCPTAPHVRTKRHRHGDTSHAARPHRSLLHPSGDRIPQNGIRWWAREDLNLRPHAYQACALTN